MLRFLTLAALAISAYSDMGAMKKMHKDMMVFNSQSACWGKGNMIYFQVALNEAMDIDSNNYDTLVNQVVFNHLNGKDATRLVTQLREKDQSNFVAEYKQKEADFERLCQNYKPACV